MKVCMNPSCKKEFTPKRERAKFCSDLCRASFHQSKKQIEKRVDVIMAALDEVYKIEKGEKAVRLWEDLMKELGNPQIQKDPKNVPAPPPETKSILVSSKTVEIPAEEMDVLAQIAAIRDEKIPKERDTPLGKKHWLHEQQKRIQELRNQLNQK